MSENSSGGGIAALLGALVFWGFVVIKAWGHSFALWSWWWVFLPIVPWLGILVAHFNL